MKTVSEKRRRLLQALERIVGSSCYNPNIQNYEGPHLIDEGRHFRYPITFIKDGAVAKTSLSQYQVDAEAILSGHYQFGANEMAIMSALNEIISFIEKEYGVDFEKGDAPRDGIAPLSFRKEAPAYKLKVTSKAIVTKIGRGSLAKSYRKKL